MDVFWIAAVVTILVEGGTLVRVVWRFMKKNRNNPRMTFAIGTFGIAWSIVISVFPPPRDAAYWFVPIVVLLTAGMGGGMIASGFWQILVNSYKGMVDEQFSLLERIERGRGRSG